MALDPGFGDAHLHEETLWKALLSVADDATEEADRIIYGAIHAAAPELSDSNTPVLLSVPQAEAAFETILLSIEGTLKLLCAEHDYRQFLHVSRLCSGIPALKREDKNHEDTRVRTLNADRWILRCAPSKFHEDYMIMRGNDYRLRAISDSLCHDAAKLHVLAHFHQRVVVERRRFNFMRLVSARNSLRGPTMRLHEDITVGWDLHTKELYGSLLLFNEREHHANRALAWWGMGDVGAGNEFFALSADPNSSLYKTGNLFNPRAISLDAWLEYGRRFRALFERDIDMPAEHFWAISRALGRLGLRAAVDDGGRLQRWANLTATIPVRRDDLLGGRLARLAAAELEGLGSSGDTRQGLDHSVDRFVQLASSTAGTPALKAARAEAEGPDGGSPGSATLRSIFYPYMVHGIEEHDYWVVDYLMTIPFIQGVVNELEFSRSDSTTPSNDSDTFVRTSVFDAHLARQLTGIPGYEEVFSAHRTNSDLPNATFTFNEGAESREIDVPLRLGEVLVAVQTWTRKVNARARAGERRAMEKRWNEARDKLKYTDQKYTDFLLGKEEGRDHMLSEGLRYILPVVCGPYAEPLVSLEQRFWLRYPRFRSPEVPEDAVPRILTPPELAAFLEDATELELKTICEQNDWTL